MAGQPGGLRGDKAQAAQAEPTARPLAEAGPSNALAPLVPVSTPPAPALQKTPVATVPQVADQVGIRVYHTSYITALELKLLVAPLLTERTGVVSVSTRSEAAAAAGRGGSNEKSGNNEVLVVRDYETVLAQMDRLVAEVDVRPAQLSIEAIILGVKLRERDNSGVSFLSLSQNPSLRFDLGSPATSLINANIGGLKFGFLDGTLDAFFDVLERIGPTDVIADVIATARLTVLARPRLKNQVGQQRGYVGPQVADPMPAKSIPLLDIGAQLRLQPYVFGDGLIHMEIESGPADQDTAADGGMASHQAITQVITLRDGCTAVIGGVIRQQPNRSDSQLPLLASLPLSGFVYRQTNATPGREEVLALITPQLVRETGPAVARPANKRPPTAAAAGVRHGRPIR
jgi:type II secretory pathway component GspD/PulD (secretin)